MTPRTICSALLAVSLLTAGLFPQARKLSPKELPAAAFKLISIKVTGSQRYSPQEVITASGLQLGDTVSDADFKTASQHLGDTGAFSDIVYSFQYSPEGTQLEFQVTDSDQLVPVRFDNFVWFSDQELFQRLHIAVPLFQGKLPVAGNLADQVSDGLQALLIGLNISGQVDYLRSAHEDGPIEAFLYSVSGPTIHIRNVDFTGAAPTELPLLQAAAKAMQGGIYLRSILRAQEDKDLLPVYLQRGYLKASIGDAQPKVVQQDAQATLVDVTLAVDPRRQYKLDGVWFAGNKAFSADELGHLIQGQPGQPANAVQLDEDCQAMEKLYGTRGYLAAGIQTVPEFDENQSKVRFLLTVREGDVYKMGDLELQGLDSHTTARLQGEWQLRGGDVFDASYPQKFLKEAMKELSLMGGWNVSVHETRNEKDKTVDVTMRFDPKPSR